MYVMHSYIDSTRHVHYAFEGVKMLLQKFQICILYFYNRCFPLCFFFRLNFKIVKSNSRFMVKLAFNFKGLRVLDIGGNCHDKKKIFQMRSRKSLELCICRMKHQVTSHAEPLLWHLPKCLSSSSWLFYDFINTSVRYDWFSLCIKTETFQSGVTVVLYYSWYNCSQM